MGFILHILGTAVAFVVVMLSASLIVTMLVRIVHYLGDTRSRTVAEMIAVINRGYRQHHGDRAMPGDDSETAFVLDVLGDPSLHASKDIAAYNTALDGGILVQPKRLDVQRKRLALRVEYLTYDDFLHIVRAHASHGFLPPTWCGQLRTSDRALPKFEHYLAQWFRTAEGVSSEQFRRDTRRLVAILSCVLVVAFNLDGVHLITGLYGNAELRDMLAHRAPDILASAEKVNATDGPDHRLPVDSSELLIGTGDYLAQNNALLSEPALELGWQNSWIVRQYCVYKKACEPIPGVHVPTTLRGWLWDIVTWLLGLGFACMMLSLGAPFWAGRLKELLNLGNAIVQRKQLPLPATSAGPANDTDPTQR